MPTEYINIKAGPPRNTHRWWDVWRGAETDPPSTRVDSKWRAYNNVHAANEYAAKLQAEDYRELRILDDEQER